MVTIKIHKNNKSLISETGVSTYDNLINELIDEVEDDMPFFEVDYSPSSSIKLKKTTLERLESFKLTDGESYENIIVRLLLAKDLSR